MADSPPVIPAPSSPPMPLPDQVALVLQGGGALGAFQAGVFSALSRFAIDLDWVAGISIGAINAALIAGNPKGKRRAALTTFWDGVSSGLPGWPMMPVNSWREAAHLASASAIANWGVPGFFRPWGMAGWFPSPGSAAATSFYDTGPLIKTLDRLIDWRLLNDGPIRLSVGAVDVESGNFIYFDNKEGDWAGRIDARHILASGALPPGFAAVEIDGRHYWDGGLVSNTPLQHVIDHAHGDLLVFQVDLFPAHGPRPRDISDVMSREKDIRFSSRTRAVTDQYLRARQRDRAICALLTRLPPALRATPEAQALVGSIDSGAVNIVQLIYRNRAWQTSARDFEFSPAAIADHRAQGEKAVSKAIANGDLIAQNIRDGVSAAFDLSDAVPDSTPEAFPAGKDSNP